MIRASPAVTSSKAAFLGMTGKTEVPLKWRFPCGHNLRFAGQSSSKKCCDEAHLCRYLDEIVHFGEGGEYFSLPQQVCGLFVPSASNPATERADTRKAPSPSCRT